MAESLPIRCKTIFNQSIMNNIFISPIQYLISMLQTTLFFPAKLAFVHCHEKKLITLNNRWMAVMLRLSETEALLANFTKWELYFCCLNCVMVRIHNVLKRPAHYRYCRLSCCFFPFTERPIGGHCCIRRLPREAARKIVRSIPLSLSLSLSFSVVLYILTKKGEGANLKGMGW